MMTPGDRIKIKRKAKKLSQGKLGELCGWGAFSQTRISNYELNLREPYLEDFKKIAKVLEVSSDWLLLGKEKEDKSTNFEKIPTKKIPLFTWEELLSGDGNFNQQFTKESLQMIVVPNLISDKCFAVKVVSDSMIASAGSITFLPHEIIVIDPEKPYKSGSYIVALNSEAKECHFRQFITDGGINYLKPLNPQYPLIKAEGYKILGTCCYKMSEID